MRIYYHWILTIILAFLMADNILWNVGFPIASERQAADPECLWSPSIGQNVSKEDADVFENVGQNGLRVSYPSGIRRRPYRVLFLGCSFTYGVGVADQDTYVWRINELCPELLADNGAVGGYGPLRSLFRLRRLLPLHRYDLVVYAAIDDHLQRCSLAKTRFENSERVSPGGRRIRYSDLYAMPYTELAPDFRFVDHRLSRGRFLFDSISPFSNFLNQYYTTYKVRRVHVPAIGESGLVFTNVMERMAMLAAAYDCRFLLVSLDRFSDAYRPLLPDWMNFFDASRAKDMRQEDLVLQRAGNHPGAGVHNVASVDICPAVHQV